MATFSVTFLQHSWLDTSLVRWFRVHDCVQLVGFHRHSVLGGPQLHQHVMDHPTDPNVCSGTHACKLQPWRICLCDFSVRDLTEWGDQSKHGSHSLYALQLVEQRPRRRVRRCAVAPCGWLYRHRKVHLAVEAENGGRQEPIRLSSVWQRHALLDHSRLVLWNTVYAALGCSIISGDLAGVLLVCLVCSRHGTHLHSGGVSHPSPLIGFGVLGTHGTYGLPFL
mmetsp:Transcript_37347/g.93829  ORF Transcript_37347/g.93829 Transcript_37347/m.93829 type:complete len:223 (-) Transcript_37347:537-1205(-)